MNSQDVISRDQKLVAGFLNEFASKLSSLHDLDFILLFGSAARGEWKRGVSDVDLIIQVKNQGEKKEIKKRAEELFWVLDEKHDTMFREVCSTSEEAEDRVEGLLKKGQRKVRLYAPFEVLGPKDVNWEKGEFRDTFLKLGLDLVAPKYLLLAKMKTEGKVIYGWDITRTIRLKISWYERVKAILVPHHLSFLAALLSPLAPGMAAKMAIKAAIYSVESSLYYLKKPIGRGIKAALAELELEIGRSRYASAEHFRRAYELKYLIGEIKITRWNSFRFCLRTFYEVVKLNWWAILHRLKGKLGGE